jgi:TRAP-type C4-dicarboxylate transport system permease small subunit
MTDFLRVISPYIYALVPILILLFVAYKVTMKSVEDDVKSSTKKIFKWVFYGVLLIFSIAVIRIAMINEVPRSDIDHSVKKERSNYAIEKSKKDTITIQ